MSEQHQEPKTFGVRFRNVALTYGIPLWVLDIVTERHYNVLGAMLDLPFIILAVLGFTYMEDWIARWFHNHRR